VLPSQCYEWLIVGWRSEGSLDALEAEKQIGHALYTEPVCMEISHRLKLNCILTTFTFRLRRGSNGIINHYTPLLLAARTVH